MSGSLFASTAFQAGSRSHFAALAVTVLTALIMLHLARRKPGAVTRGFELALAAVLILQWPANVLVAWHMELLSWANGLPCHMCDLAALVGAHALVTRNRLSCEILYFWGLAGTVQGLITPALMVDWPHPRFLAFFALHGGVVVAAFYVVFGLGLTPRAGAVGRAMLWLVIYAFTASLVDLAASADRANYGFLCRKPENPSLLDHLGPWPWYVGSLGLVALVIFSVLDLPFAMQRRSAPRE